MSEKPETFARRLQWRLQTVGFDVLSALVRLIPVDVASAMGGAVVRTLGPLTPEHQTADKNLRLAFPELNKAERRKIILDHWENLGRTAAEFPMMDRLTPASGRVEIVGGERLVEIAKSGQPAILVSGHLANWEVMMAVIVHLGVKCRVSYRPANNPYVDKRIFESRRRYGVELFAARGNDGSRGMISALQKGEAVALLNDQRDNAGVDAPFFGRTVRTAGGPTRFALKFGGRMVPMSVRRLKGARFRVTVHEPILLEQTGDKVRDVVAGVTKVNAFMEEVIRQQPSQWLWSHRRWPWEAYDELEPEAA